MTSMDERRQKKDYANWLKVTYGLKHVKDGLSTLTETIMAQFQQEILEQNNLSSVEACNNKSCNSDSIMQQGVDKFQCPNNVCHNLLKSIAEEHINKKKIIWKNCEVRCWPVKCWEIAKVYMTYGQSSANTGAATTDCSALLQLMRSCKKFRSKIQIKPDTAEKVN